MYRPSSKLYGYYNNRGLVHSTYGAITLLKSCNICELRSLLQTNDFLIGSQSNRNQNLYVVKHTIRNNMVIIFIFLANHKTLIKIQQLRKYNEATNLTNINSTLIYTQIWVETYGLKHGSNGSYYVNLFEYNEML